MSTVMEPVEREASPKMEITYPCSETAIAELRQQYAGMTCDTPENYEATRKAIGTIRSYRVAIEQRRKDLKADSLAWGKKVDAVAKELTNALMSIEEPLKIAKQAVDDEKEKQRREAELAELRKIEEEIQLKRAEEEARLRVAREAEDKRLAEERDRLAAEKAKFDEERKKILAEADELRKKAAEERAKRDAEARAERERLEVEINARREAEKKKIDAERKANDDAQRIAQAKIDAENKRLAEERDRLEKMEREQLAKEKSEREEKERVERERAEAERKQREAEEAAKLAEEQKPDLEKVHQFSAILRKVKLPEVSGKEAKAFVKVVAAELNAIAGRCQSVTSFAVPRS